ncbi:hypothetical protein I5R65_19245 [Herbaspirillum sp. AP02]|uniref:hypothetical protein n=1 Tax=unclassified Herbaspirillum TaxID=2624150 RepID=UPI0015DA0B33|nr:MULTISPECIES: hypothetical protein [unclassified Herbaspirillum]MBG7621611.1 hypothetical protein [Herbaspirillum sp. AP02]NZD69698.1 hypothetical protein [Herbaspirillum sp. AP21]
MDSSEELVAVQHTLIELTINETTYTVENRIYDAPGGEHVAEYRVLLGQQVIKDWTRGNFVKYVHTQYNDNRLH